MAVQIELQMPIEWQRDPVIAEAFKEYIDQESSRYDSPKERAITCLHEGTHVYYMRECGFEPTFYGPRMFWEAEKSQFTRYRASVETLPVEIQMSADPLLVTKSYIGPIFVEEKMLAHRHADEILRGAQRDIDNFYDWFCRRHQKKKDVHPKIFEDAREAVYKECRKPVFREKLWSVAHEFELKVFGPRTC